MALDYRSAALAALLVGSAGVASAVSPDQLPERIRSAQAALDRLQADYAQLRRRGVRRGTFVEQAALLPLLTEVPDLERNSRARS